jgi:hypothetical protein
LLFFDTIPYFKPLSDVEIVWARVDSDFFSRFLQHLEYHLGYTSLPVGSCDMDALEALLGIAKISTRSSDIIERVVLGDFCMEELCEDLLICIIHLFFLIKN